MLVQMRGGHSTLYCFILARTWLVLHDHSYSYSCCILYNNYNLFNIFKLKMESTRSDNTAVYMIQNMIQNNMSNKVLQTLPTPGVITYEKEIQYKRKSRSLKIHTVCFRLPGTTWHLPVSCHRISRFHWYILS